MDIKYGIWKDCLANVYPIGTTTTKKKRYCARVYMVEGHIHRKSIGVRFVSQRFCRRSNYEFSSCCCFFQSRFFFVTDSICVYILLLLFFTSFCFYLVLFRMNESLFFRCTLKQIYTGWQAQSVRQPASQRANDCAHRAIFTLSIPIQFWFICRLDFVRFIYVIQLYFMSALFYLFIAELLYTLTHSLTRVIRLIFNNRSV